MRHLLHPRPRTTRTDWVGFDPELQLLNGGFGLIGMQERSQRLGGQLTLKSSPGQGTTLTVSLPVTA